MFRNSDTTHTNFPHHWDCQYLEGHPDNKRCCIVSDGSTREPDGSIVMKKQIREGKGGMMCHNFYNSTKEVYIEDEGWVKQRFD